MLPLNEDTLVQHITADYLQAQLGWESAFAYNNETFGKEGALGYLVSAFCLIPCRYNSISFGAGWLRNAVGLAVSP